MDEQLGANEYGLVHASYSGSGMLRGRRGEEEPCSFHVFQLRDGLVIALSEVRGSALSRVFALNGAESLVGTTADGQAFTASGLFETPYLPPLTSSESSIYRAHICQEINVGEPLPDSSSRSSCFAVTNLKLATLLPIKHPSAQGQVRRIGDYADRVRRLKFTKAVDVTAELDVESTDPEVRIQVAQDVCQLLSLAQGGRLQWISRVDYSHSGAAMHWYHASLVTKPYSGLPIIDPHERDDTARFLEAALPTYLDRKEPWGLANGPLDAYLDAKAEGDFLQLRGLKLAVALEMLKSALIGAEKVPEFVRPRSEFAEMIPDLKSAVRGVLSQCGWQSSDRAISYENLQGLNRVPFRRLVKSLCSAVGLCLSEPDLRLFVKCRNSLVHRGLFYCQTADDAERISCPPHDTPVQEFFWVLHIMDLLFLRLVGYDGPWVDWSNPGHPKRRDSLL